MWPVEGCTLKVCRRLVGLGGMFTGFHFRSLVTGLLGWPSYTSKLQVRGKSTELL